MREIIKAEVGYERFRVFSCICYGLYLEYYVQNNFSLLTASTWRRLMRGPRDFRLRGLRHSAQEPKKKDSVFAHELIIGQLARLEMSKFPRSMSNKPDHLPCCTRRHADMQSPRMSWQPPAARYLVVHQVPEIMDLGQSALFGRWGSDPLPKLIHDR
jgi:hypothetical protein